MTVKKAAGRTVFLMMAATVLAKGLGVLRQMLIASHYGAGGAADAFNAAQALPLTMFDILLGDNLAGRKEYIALHGNEYIEELDVS